MKTLSLRQRVAACMACVGGLAILAQVMFMREMLVAVSGNELVIGAILACWMAGVSVGALAARYPAATSGMPERGRVVLAALLLVMGLALAPQVFVLRTLRGILSIPPGEYVSFGALCASALAVFLPTCFAVGCAFPVACAVWAGDAAGRGSTAAAGRVYMMESLGSALCGLALSFLVLPRRDPVAMLALGLAIAFAGFAVIVRPRGLRGAGWLIALGGLVLCLWNPPWMGRVERWAETRRWRAAGVLPPVTGAGSVTSVKLAAWRNTVYQNLAVTESSGQYALYANGEVVSIFPDPIGYEHAVHFVMAQNPEAKRVLLLGGNPVGEAPELLAYPIDRLVMVDLDPGAGQLVAGLLPEASAAVSGNPAVIVRAEDAPRFVQQCRESFDLVYIQAPDPVTAAANRFYTREFFVQIRRILAPGGFLYTSIASSERLHSEAVAVGASVVATLRDVFPVVLVTAEERNRLFAAGRGAGLTFDRRTLYERSRRAGIQTEYFRPEYFLACDEIDPDKCAFVESRFRERESGLNTSLRPIVYFYNLLLWGRFSGSVVRGVLASALRVPPEYLSAGAVAVGALCLCLGTVLSAGTGRRPDARAAAWARGMTAALLLSTGFCGMSLEVLLIFTFQNVYGYVYSRIGAIVGLFMFGLVAGAAAGNRQSARGRSGALLTLAGAESLLAAIALLVPALAAAGLREGASTLQVNLAALAVHAAVAIVGLAVGAEFASANRVFRLAGGTAGSAASATFASDSMGAALGALGVGVVLIPVAGLQGTALVLASLKTAGLLMLLSAARGVRRAA